MPKTKDKPTRRKPGKRDPRQQDSDYDGAWKAALRRHLAAFMALFFPRLFALIDWSVEPEWLDKELGQILAREGKRAGRVDLLFKVRLLTGESQWVLFHVEIQSSPEEAFEFRLACYNAGILWAYRERVVTLAILADLQEDWLPTEDVYQFGDFETRLKFPVCKLIQKLDEWKDNPSLPAQLARAQIAALRTARDPEGRFNAKRQLIRNLFSEGCTADVIREALGLIDWMMRLRTDLETQLRTELIEMEKTLEPLPFVTSFERLARAEAKAEAKVEATSALAAMLLTNLTEACGQISEDVAQRVQALDFSDLLRLSNSLLASRSLANLTNWLEAEEKGARRKQKKMRASPKRR